MDLTVKKERVLEAAASCPDAKNVLQKLFPEVFVEDDKTVPLLPTDMWGGIFPKGHPMHGIIQVRSSGPNKEKGLYLSTLYNDYEYSLETDPSAAYGMFLRVSRKKK